MKKFRAKLTADVAVPATCEIVFEADSLEAAEEQVHQAYELLYEEFQRKLKKFRMEGGPYPKVPFSWDVDASDIVDPEPDEVEMESLEEEE